MDEHAGASLTKNLEARDKVHSCTKSKFFFKNTKYFKHTYRKMKENFKTQKVN